MLRAVPGKSTGVGWTGNEFVSSWWGCNLISVFLVLGVKNISVFWVVGVKLVV